MKYAYKIFHINEVSEARDTAVSNIKSILKDIPELQSTTINYSDENEVSFFKTKFAEFNPRREFKIGELGIWASNYYAWNEFLNSEYDVLLLFEDDIKIDDNFILGIDSYINRLPDSWDFFMPFVHWWQANNIYNKDRDDFGDQDICKAYQSWSLAAYVVSKNGAKKILDSLLNGFDDPVDWYIFKNKSLFNTYTLKPEANKFCDLLYLQTTIQEETMSKYPNWFMNGANIHFNKHLSEFSGKKDLQFLQIGTYTGDASEWMLDNILTGENSYLTDVDTWGGSEEEIHKTFDWNDVEKVYDEKVSKYNNVIKKKTTSLEFLNNANLEFYDFIYIDGDHTEDAVYKDAVASWDKLKKGGILGFDDYTWQHDSGRDDMRPGPAIDRFVKEYEKEIDVLEAGDQYWIRKRVNPLWTPNRV